MMPRHETREKKHFLMAARIHVLYDCPGSQVEFEWKCLRFLSILAMAGRADLSDEDTSRVLRMGMS
jgi:hypothetical protein